MTNVKVKITDIPEGEIKFFVVSRDGINLFMSLMLSGFIQQMQVDAFTVTSNLYEDERGFVCDGRISDDIIIGKVEEYCSRFNI